MLALRPYRFHNIPVGKLDNIERLQKTYDRVVYLHESKFFPKTLSWTAAEREISPSDARELTNLPPLRSKAVCVVAKEALLPRRNVLREHNRLPLVYIDRATSI